MAHESTVWVRYGRLYGLIVWPGLALIPVCFWSILCYIDRDLSRAYNIYISEINVSYICYMMPACMIYVSICMYIIYIYVCIYTYIYRNICMMKFLWNFILKFFFKQIGSCHGTGFVVAGGTTGCHNNLWCRQGWQNGLYGSARLFNVQCIQCTHDLSLLAPIFHPKLSRMLHSSLFCELRILMKPNQSFGFLLPVLCSMSCYTDRDISKASRNYISETSVSHINYIMLTCIISLP